ncbi:PREDICTED: leucine-rich repeat-containing protein 19 [Thamnophis sirtalis]|uniref:Leucine-rich repeat-containing protein 19 n=1 Tax=Thamnophis sirtalis TaxID=35019 RepID=A0A6I9X581_9SAUR|nr:PREDICTED: leucine-rich repeat-containing protein 19 [Thamnophis sirtalis]
MKLAWLLILVAVLFLHPVSTECTDISQNVNYQEVAKNYSSVPSNLNKDISVLYLSCNNITLDKNDTVRLCQYNNLSELYLNNNSIVVVSNYSFEKLSHLKILDVSNNYIKTVEKAAFAGLNELQILNLQNNKITQLNSNVFAGLNKLKVLNLQNNFLKDFHVERKFNSICIKLNGNVWNCSCDLFSLQHWLNRATVITETVDNTTSPIPVPLKEYPITNFTSITSNCKQMGISGKTVPPFISINTTYGTTYNYTNGSAYSGIQPIGKSWTFLMGVLVVILSTTALIIAAIKFPMWYRYLRSYNHRRLQEKEESELYEETFTPQLCMPPQASETNEEESIVVFEQFHPYVPEDDGFIEDKYIDP